MLLRSFYESWAAVLNRQLPTDELDVPVNQPSSDNDVIETSSLLEESPMEAGTPFHEDLKAFLSIGFTHHMESFIRLKLLKNVGITSGSALLAFGMSKRYGDTSLPKTTSIPERSSIILH